MNEKERERDRDRERARVKKTEEDDPIEFVVMLFLSPFSICTHWALSIEYGLLTKDEKVEMTFLFGFLLYTFQFVCTSLLAFYLASETLVKILSSEHTYAGFALFFFLFVFPINGFVGVDNVLVYR